jgi:cystathionine gamma-lyase
MSSTFAQSSPGEHKGYEYARTSNPTRRAFEENIASLENAKYALAFASGSAATVTITHLLNSGDHVISVDDVYGGTQRYFRRVATPTSGINFTFIDFDEEGPFSSSHHAASREGQAKSYEHLRAALDKYETANPQIAERVRQELKRIITGIDRNHDSEIDAGEFVTLAAHCDVELSIAEAKQFLTSIDKDGNAKISVNELFAWHEKPFGEWNDRSTKLDWLRMKLRCRHLALAGALNERTRMVWIETPTNPNLKVIDIKKTAQFCKRNNLLLVVDNTFLSPYLQNPLDLGADIVVHSVTKYINGHSDCVLGVLATNDAQLHERLKFLQNSIGAVPSPFDCYLALRGTKTLAIRMREHCKNAMQIALWLEKNDKVERVVYPGLQSHPHHEIAARQQKDFGGMITFYIVGGIEQSRAFLENLKLFTCAESLGGVESLIELPAIMTHASVPPEERKKLGISDTLIRISVGIEDVEDLIADLAAAFGKVKL